MPTLVSQIPGMDFVSGRANVRQIFKGTNRAIFRSALPTKMYVDQLKIQPVSYEGQIFTNCGASGAWVSYLGITNCEGTGLMSEERHGIRATISS